MANVYVVTTEHGNHYCQSVRSAARAVAGLTHEETGYTYNIDALASEMRQSFKTHTHFSSVPMQQVYCHGIGVEMHEMI